MIARLSKILLFSMALLISVHGQESLEVVPHNDIIEKKLFNIIKSDSVSNFPKIFKEKIKPLLFDLGYCNAFLSNDNGRNVIHLDEQVLIKNLVIDSLKFNPKIKNDFIGRTFSKINIEELISEILRVYSNNGYPFCKVSIKKIEIEGKYGSLVLGVEEGRLSKIEKFQITGNDDTKDYVILRNININKGELYSEERIENIQSSLSKLRLFKFVSKPGYFFDSDDKGVLSINVEEQNTNYFDGIIGYVPDKQNNDNYFTGFVELSFLNLFGTKRELKFNWKKLDRNSQFVLISYKEPWILGFPVSGSLQFEQYKQDSTYINRNYNVSLTYSINEFTEGTFLFDYLSTIPGNIKFQTISNSNSYRYGFKLVLDYRDNIYSPTKGFYFSSTYQQVSKKLEGNSNSSYNQKRYEINFNLYQRIYKKHLFALSLSGRELKGSFIEESDLFRLGGFSNLRGYRENQFTGNRVAWSNIEYRYLIDSRTYAFLFYDLGYIKKTLEADDDLEVIKNSFGFGINIQTNLGILGVRYAVGEDDSFNNGKIHFGIINEF